MSTANRMPFGKYKGRPLSSLPDDYLGWLVTRELRWPLSAAVQNEIKRRQWARRDFDYEPQYDQHPSGAMIDVRGIAAAWYRRLAVEFHPDKGGSHEAMKAINRGRELLFELVGISP